MPLNKENDKEILSFNRHENKLLCHPANIDFICGIVDGQDYMY